MQTGSGCVAYEGGVHNRSDSVKFSEDFACTDSPNLKLVHVVKPSLVHANEHSTVVLLQRFPALALFAGFYLHWPYLI